MISLSDRKFYEYQAFLFHQIEILSVICIQSSCQILKFFFDLLEIHQSFLTVFSAEAVGALESLI